MKPRKRLALAVFAGVLAWPGAGGQERDREAPPVRMPSGKSQQEEILKAEHEQSLKDVTEIIAAAEQLKTELEKNDRYIVSVQSLKTTERIEKLARRIRTRLRRY